MVLSTLISRMMVFDGAVQSQGWQQTAPTVSKRHIQAQGPCSSVENEGGISLNFDEKLLVVQRVDTPKEQSKFVPAGSNRCCASTSRDSIWSQRTSRNILLSCGGTSYEFGHDSLANPAAVFDRYSMLYVIKVQTHREISSLLLRVGRDWWSANDQSHTRTQQDLLLSREATIILPRILSDPNTQPTHIHERISFIADAMHICASKLILGCVSC